MTEVAVCERLMTEYEIHQAQKKVRIDKIAGTDGLPFEVYLNFSQVCSLASKDL